MVTVDAKGRSCPEPVLMTKKALKENPAGVTVLVDSVVPMENIKRFASNAGYQVKVSGSGEDYTIEIKK